MKWFSLFLASGAVWFWPGWGSSRACENPIFKIGSDIRITNSAWSKGSPSLAWTGSEYGVSWHDGRDGASEIYFARVSAGGDQIGSEVRITHNSFESSFPSLRWTGSEFGLSWEDSRDRWPNYEIYLVRVSAAGAPIGSELRITDDAKKSSGASLVWTGSEYGLSWQDDRDGNFEIYFARVSAGGDKIGSEVRITTAEGDGAFPSLAWTGSEYGAGWRDFRDGNWEIYFARLSAAGEKIGSDLRITQALEESRLPSLAWTGSEYGVSWEDFRAGNWEIYFARLSAGGDRIGTEFRISRAAEDGRHPSLVWTGSEYGLSWFDSRDGNYEIYLARLSAAGDQIGSDLRVTSAANQSMDPSLVWTGSEYGASWWERRDFNDQIYFARIGTLADEDGDCFPDGWEREHGCMQAQTADALLDYDSDNLNNRSEYEKGSDPCNPDSDGDGLNDGLEALTLLTNPADPDTDRDGIADREEIYTNFTDPRNPDTDFGGEADGSELAAGRNPLDPADDLPWSAVGTGTESWNYPLGAGSEDERASVIYLAGEIGLEGLISSVALEVTTPPGQALNNFTIRIKQTPLGVFPNPGASWQGPGEGWTVVYQRDTKITSTGWHTFDLATPFAYHSANDGADNLMIDFSFNNDRRTSDGLCRSSQPGGYRTISFSTDSSYGSPLDWAGISNPTSNVSTRIPNLKIGFKTLEDSDQDGLSDNWEKHYRCLKVLENDNLLDYDADRLQNAAESSHATDPCDADTDHDGLRDGWEVGNNLNPRFDDAAEDADRDSLTNLQEFRKGTNPRKTDTDGDGLSDRAELLKYFTNPRVADTDRDGLSDAKEVLTAGTNPLDPDSDHDLMPDGFEFKYRACLNPLADDGLADSDNDGLANVHEFFNGSNPCDPGDPQPGKAGVSVFGDVDGNGVLGVPDLDLIAQRLAGDQPEALNGRPGNDLILDLDGDRRIGVTDLDILAAILGGKRGVFSPGTPDSLTRLLPSGIPAVAVGNTVGIKVKLSFSGAPPRPGFGVVFNVVSGSATLFGGEGTPAGGYPAGARYDLTNPAGEARMTLRVNAAGAIKVQVQLPADPQAHTPEVTLAPELEVTGKP